MSNLTLLSAVTETDGDEAWVGINLTSYEDGLSQFGLTIQRRRNMLE